VGTDRNLQLSERDRALLAALAEQRVMIAAQLATHLQVRPGTADARARRLERLGLIDRHRVFRERPAALTITRRGLQAIERSLPAPELELSTYRHDLGLGWIWLAARGGSLGDVGQLVGEREMRSHDRRDGSEHEPYGVGLAGFERSGRRARHYPDLMLIRPDGTRVAVELELTTKSRRRLDTIMRAYAGDGQIAAVLYLVPDARMQRWVQAAVVRAGVADLVAVRRLSGDIHGALADSGRRARARSPIRAAGRTQAPTTTARDRGAELVR
jgi:DNA-binding MarR family transcriptional regulator